jgi:hypothetical protein
MYKIIGADHKEYGPVSADQITQWITQGRVNAHTRAQAEGGDWKPLGMFPEFANLFNPALSNQPGTTIPQDTSIPAQPPAAIRVFGILNIVFGSLRFLCVPLSLVTLTASAKRTGRDPFLNHWLIFSLFLGMIIGALMLTSGIGLCKMRPWARWLAICTSAVVCVLTLVNSAIAINNHSHVVSTPESYKAGLLFGVVFGVAFGFAYNVLLIVFLGGSAVNRALSETRP